MEHVCSFDDLTEHDLKGCIRDGARGTATYPDERCRQHRPSGSVSTPVRKARINLFVKRGVECGPVQLAPAAPRVFPVGNLTGNSFTILLK